MSSRSRRRRGRSREEGPAQGAGSFWEQVSTLLIAVAIALAIRTFVIEPFRIPSGSMLPTLLIGDHLFVTKFVYGIKIPFTDVRLPAVREPERGDVVVFTVAKRGPETIPADLMPELAREEFVKRIVGLPGDLIDVQNDVLIINGKPVQSRPLDEEFFDEHHRALEVREETIGDRTFRTLDDPHQSLRPPYPVRVPEGRYFMMGDNRDHSKDSRAWDRQLKRPDFMTIRLAEIKGPAYRLYWSWNFNGPWGVGCLLPPRADCLSESLLNPVTWWELFTEKMRWDRIGQRVR